MPLEYRKMNERLAIFYADEPYFNGLSTKNTFFTNTHEIARLKSQYDKGDLIMSVPSGDTIDEGKNIGTIMRIKQILSPHQALANVIFETVMLAEYDVVNDEVSGPVADNIRPIRYEEPLDPVILLGLKARMLASYDEYQKLTTSTGFVHTPDNDDVNDLVNYIADEIGCTDKRIYYSRDTEYRTVLLCAELDKKVDIENIESRVAEKVQNAMDQNQREYYVREQIKALNEEIDEEDEGKTYLDRIEKLSASQEVKDKLKKDVKRLSRMQSTTPEAAIMKNYLDFVLELPWGKNTTDNESLQNAKDILDQDHYGIKKVKERLLEALAVRKLSPDAKSPIICLYGPPGVGKTSIARSIAKAMNKNYVRLSFGGVRDEAEIRGHRKTYVGAMPGRIISSIHSAGSSNPVFLMDEIDKMAADYKGDPASALLEVLDPEQNVNFRDHYLELPFDLSKVLFITTANSIEPISAPLLDRMEVVEMTGYTEDEKFQIAKRHLVAKVMENNGIEKGWVTITDNAIKTVINSYTRESGVRGLEKQLSAIMRKVAVMFVDNPDHKPVRVTEKNIESYLGKPKYTELALRDKDEVGIANGLAWTSVGGTMLTIETALASGKGNVVLTGNLGTVMQESAKTALTYVKTVADKYGIDASLIKDNDVHVHVPEGAVPKDGPSAGITIASAILSAFTKKPLRRDVAMTGEISLVGKVLPIGGLKEKTLAALRQGITEVVLPDGNKKDYEELPDVVKKGIKFHFAKTYDDVAKVVFCEQ